MEYAKHALSVWNTTSPYREVNEEIQVFWRDTGFGVVPPTQENIYHLWWATVKVMHTTWYFVGCEVQGDTQYSHLQSMCLLPSGGKGCHSDSLRSGKGH